MGDPEEVAPYIVGHCSHTSTSNYGPANMSCCVGKVNCVYDRSARRAIGRVAGKWIGESLYGEGEGPSGPNRSRPGNTSIKVWNGCHNSQWLPREVSAAIHLCLMSNRRKTCVWVTMGLGMGPGSCGLLWVLGRMGYYGSGPGCAASIRSGLISLIPGLHFV